MTPLYRPSKCFLKSCIFRILLFFLLFFFHWRGISVSRSSFVFISFPDLLLNNRECVIAKICWRMDNANMIKDFINITDKALKIETILTNLGQLQKEVGSEMKKFRESKKFGLKSFAVLMEMSSRQLNNMESGKSPYLLEYILSAVDVAIMYNPKTAFGEPEKPKKKKAKKRKK